MILEAGEVEVIVSETHAPRWLVALAHGLAYALYLAAFFAFSLALWSRLAWALAAVVAWLLIAGRGRLWLMLGIWLLVLGLPLPEPSFRWMDWAPFVGFVLLCLSGPLIGLIDHLLVITLGIRGYRVRARGRQERVAGRRPPVIHVTHDLPGWPTPPFIWEQGWLLGVADSDGARWMAALERTRVLGLTMRTRLSRRPDAGPYRTRPVGLSWLDERAFDLIRESYGHQPLELVELAPADPGAVQSHRGA